MPSPPVTVVQDSLYAMGDVAATSGALTWLPESETAYEPINAFLLVQRDEALLVDTGVSAHEETLISQLRQLVPRGMPVSIIFTRFEGDTLTNLGPILRNFSVRRVIGGGVSNPFDFFDDLSPQEHIKTDHDVELTRMRAGEDIVIGAGRAVEILSTSLRCLTTSWLYDNGTGTLFTSDAFGYHGLDSSDRRDLVIDSLRGPIDLNELRPRIFTKFDWILDAECEPLIQDLERIFTTRDVQNIAPTHGRVIRGKEMVDAYYQATIALLEQCGQLAEAGVNE